MDDTCQVATFDVGERVGRGGMSRVYRAEHRRTGRPAALKIVTPERARRDDFRRAFRREVRALAALDHPGIARVYDYGELGEEQSRCFGEDVPPGAPWLAMEFVDGSSLSAWPASWSWARVRDLLAGLLDALAHAHARGVIHRDLKPSNLLVVSDEAGGPGLKVVDFGIARMLWGGTEGKGPSGHDSITGTPKYMAPEQVRGNWRNQGPWTDLYAVGCIGWRVICGRAPFVSDDSTEVLRAHIQAHLPDLDPLAPVPAELEGWLRTLLEKLPSARFQRAADAADALREMDAPSDGAADEGREGGAPESQPFATTLVTAPPEELESVEGNDGGATEAERESPAFGADGWSPPEPPETWRRPEPAERSRELERTGLRLFPLRTIPVVDRQQERDRLWGDLRGVWESGEPAGVVLHGSSGLGKSRLAVWLARRAHELGAAKVVRLSHRRLDSPSDGIRRMLRREFRCEGLDRTSVVGRIQKLLQRRFGVEGDVVMHDAALLGHLARGGTEETRPGRHHGPRQRRLALLRWLEACGDRRPLLVWLDDVQWGRDSLALVRSIFRERDSHDLPVLAVMTVDSNAEGVDSGAREVLEGIAERDEVRSTEVDPLSDWAQRNLVEELLDFEPETVERLADATDGHPLFAVQAVTDWVERGDLEMTERGLQPSANFGRALPANVEKVWGRRVETALDEADVETGRARRALECAAALGGEVDEEEWRAVCRRADVDVVDAVREPLLSRGLLEREGRRHAFAHAGLRERLADRARSAGRLKRAHRLCAETLAEIYEEAPPRGRIGVHWLHAGAPERAVEPARRAAREAYRHRHYDDASYYLEVWRAATRALGVDREDRRRVSARVLGAEIAVGIGEVDRARELVRGVGDLAEQQGWIEEQGRAMTVAGRLGVHRGAPERGREKLERATEVLQGADDERPLARAHLSLAEVLKRLGDYDAAERHYSYAAECFDETEDAALVAEIESHLAYLWVARDDYDRAREMATRALDRAREARARTAEAHALTQLGEVARFESDWERAREAYDRAARLYRSSGSRNVVICRLNRAIADVGAGRVEEGGELFDDLAEEIEAAGLDFLRPVLDAGRLCAVADGDDADWSRAWRRVERGSSEAEGVEKDLAWLLERAGERARDAEHPGRASDAFRRSAEEWRAVGDEERAERMLERADDWDGA